MSDRRPELVFGVPDLMKTVCPSNEIRAIMGQDIHTPKIVLVVGNLITRGDNQQIVGEKPLHLLFHPADNSGLIYQVELVFYFVVSKYLAGTTPTHVALFGPKLDDSIQMGDSLESFRLLYSAFKNRVKDVKRTVRRGVTVLGWQYMDEEMDDSKPDTWTMYPASSQGSYTFLTLSYQEDTEGFFKMTDPNYVGETIFKDTFKIGGHYIFLPGVL